MKKIFGLYFVCLAAMLGFVACDDSDSDPNPEPVPSQPVLTLSLVELTETSVVFQAEAENATAVHYVLQTADQEIPSVEEVLAEGLLVEDTQVSVNGLLTGTAYRVVAAARNESLTVEQVSVLDFTTPSIFEKATDFTSEYTDIWWYGTYSEGVDQFFVQLSTAEVEPLNARPQEGGQLVRFYVFAPATTADDIRLAPGTYTLGGDTNEEGTFWRDGSVYAMGTTADDWMQVGFKSGTLVIGYENGVYTIDADLVLNDGHDTAVKAHSQGEVQVENLADGFRNFYDDVNQVMTGLGGYVSPSASGMDCYVLSLYNTPVDESGFVAGAGYTSKMYLYTPASGYGVMAFEGEYTIDTTWEETDTFLPYTSISGYVYDMWGTAMPEGTFLAYCDESGQTQMAGLAQSGTIHITSKDGIYTVEADLVSDTGARMQFSYEGDASAMQDYRMPATESVNREMQAFPKLQPRKVTRVAGPGWHKFE